MGENYADGTTPQLTSPSRVLLVKMLNKLGTVASGGGSGLAGVGSPQNAITAAAGTTYYDTSGAVFWVNQNGLINGWVQLI